MPTYAQENSALACLLRCNSWGKPPWRSSEAAKQRSSEAAKQRSSEAAKQRSSEAAKQKRSVAAPD